MITIRCTYPPSKLNPNVQTRLHWAEVGKAKAKAKTMWNNELLRYRIALKSKTEFKISFAPPNKIRRDVDNLIAASKALLDALSLVTGVDDSQFKIDWARELMPPVAGGAVFIEVTE